MNKGLKQAHTRYQQIVVVLIVLMVILSFRLFMVTILQHDEWTSKASDQNTKTISTSAPRGNIYDRNGEALAINKQVFTVNFNVSALSTEEINSSALELINTLIKNGDKYTDNFPIKIDSDGKFYYTYKQQIKKWLSKQGFDTDLTAAEAFSRLCSRYNLDDSQEARFASMATLEEKYNLNIPINEDKMVYTYDQSLELFFGKFSSYEDEFNGKMTAKECFKALRKKYEIDPELSDKEARKIFIIRNEVATNGFTRYLPIKVASDISTKTIAHIEESGIPGVEVASESERVYPNKNTACHILGYLGAISESETEYYVEERGYSASDLVGKDGIEAALEEKLHGTPGTTQIRVNSAGEYVETISTSEPKKGSDVYLTIDLRLQKAAEKALAKKAAGKSGAAVAIDVETGDVLAMASYPTYNPNIFANGISDKAWDSVQQENPRDPFSPAPLYNNATKAAIQPGSTFKPITAVAALEAGLDPNRSIYDDGMIEYGEREWGCSAWNDYRGRHGSQTLEWGIGNSCNTYFYNIATGKDWDTGASLGYTMTVEDLMDTAKKFGLGVKTGIEIDEVVAETPTAAMKIENTKVGIKDYLYNNRNRFFPKSVVNDYDKLVENLATIADWTEDNPEYGELIELLRKHTQVKESQLETVAARVKFDFYIQAQWGVGDQFNFSIGQGYNAYTPLAMANYVATLGNDGVRNQASLVYGIEGEGLNVKDKPVDLKLKDGTVDEVIKGMRRVCTSGTLSGFFGNFPVAVAGKTGTAENQTLIQPKSEISYVKNHLGQFNSAAGTSVSWSKVKKKIEEMMEKDPERYPSEEDTVDDALIEVSNYKITQSMINSYKQTHDYVAWTISMAPADNPKIAVAVMIIDGGYSSNAAPVAKDILEAYLGIDDADNKVKVSKTDMDGKNRVQ